MSGPSTPGAKPEKTMSSRLLTMKFMQRAAAASATSDASPASSQSPKHKNDGSAEDPSPKRARVSLEGQGSPTVTRNSDMEAMAAAIAAEEEKRAEAVARQAAEAGETEWVLEFSGGEQGTSTYGGIGAASQAINSVPVIQADSLDDDDEPAYGGRISYGNFKRKKKVQASQTNNDDESESEDEDEDEGMDDMIRRAKNKADKKNKSQKPVNLRNLTSISGAAKMINPREGRKRGRQ